jgi:hypothetical protein
MDSFWYEMNRRERWDRMFEKRLNDLPPFSREDAKEQLNREKIIEDQKRQEWDIKYGRSIVS